MSVLKKIMALAVCAAAVPLAAGAVRIDTVPDFASVTGLVEEILPPDACPAQGRVLHLTSDGRTIHFVQHSFTYVAGKPVASGDVITVFFDPNLPVPAVYPPQHEGVFILNQPDSHVNFGHLNIYSYINEEIPVMFQNGLNFREMSKAYSLQESLEGRLLAAVRNASGALQEVVVLFEPHTAKMRGVFVNGTKLEGAAWHATNNEYLLPLRQIVDALGFGSTITWNDGIITLSNGSCTIQIQIDNPQATANNTTTFIQPPTLINGTTYLPHSFFTHFFGPAAVQLVIF